MSKDQNKKEDFEGFTKKANENAIEGRNPVLEAFRAGKPVDRLYVLDGCRDGAVLTIKPRHLNTTTGFRTETLPRTPRMCFVKSTSR